MNVDDFPKIANRPICDCTVIRGSKQNLDREVCVCAREAAGEVTLETYDPNIKDGTTAWKDDRIKPVERFVIETAPGEFSGFQSSLIFPFGPDQYVALITLGKSNADGPRSIRPVVAYGSLATKGMSIAYRGEISRQGAPSDYSVRTNTADQTVELYRLDEIEWAGKFVEPTGPKPTPAESNIDHRKQITDPEDACSFVPLVRQFSELEIVDGIRTTYKTSIVVNGIAPSLISINQSGRSLAFVDLDDDMVSHLYVHDMDLNKTTELDLPFKQIAVLGLALVGGYTEDPPIPGYPRNPPEFLFVSAKHYRGNEPSGVYCYQLRNGMTTKPELVLAGNYSGIGVNHQANQLVVFGDDVSNHGLSIFDVNEVGNIALKFLFAQDLSNISVQPVFSRDSKHVFLVTDFDKVPSLVEVECKPFAKSKKLFDGIGSVTVVTNNGLNERLDEGVLVVTKMVQKDEYFDSDGHIYTLNLVERKLKRSFESREVSCSVPVMDPARGIVYFTAKKSIDEVIVGAICSNGIN